MRRPKVFLFKFVIIITLCVLLPYFVSLRVLWKPFLNLIPEDTDSSGTKQRLTSSHSKRQHQNHEHGGTQTEFVLKEQSEQFDIKTQKWEGSTIKQQRQMLPTRKNVIILSQGRGGSSFLGGIFNCNPQVMYWFEPLFHVGKLLNVNLFMEEEPSAYKDTCSINR